MKNILLALAFLFLLSECNQFKPPLPQFILSGKIENLDAASVKFIHSLDEIIIKLNADGTFTDTIYDFVDGYYNFKAGEEYTKIYLKDGYNLFITLNVVDFDESIKFNGIGSPENNYLAQKYLNTENSNERSFYTLNESTFVHKIDSLEFSKNKFLESIISNVKEIDTDFIQKEKATNLYYTALVKENFVKYHNYINKTTDFKVSEKFYDYRSNISLENSKLLDVANYTSYVEAFLNNHVEENDTTENAFSKLRAINYHIKDNKLKKEFIYRSAKQNMSKVKKLTEYWALISFMVTEKREYKELSKLKRSIEKIQTGKDSPLTSFKDENDTIKHLVDFKGSYVYIDCWAQWCGPCKKETPFLLALEEKYKEKNIKFLKLSLDSDIPAWKSYIKEHHLEENAFVLVDNFKSVFATTYLINSIPRFILLDKELKIIDAKALRPSNKKLSAQFDALLKQD
tara:strand:- start:910 stop:2280 length:1371 start_codon:yes stop_codon:yes gene_type:complete